MNQPAPRIILVGLGLHAKRIYLHFLRQQGALPLAVVDLESNRTKTVHYLQDQGMTAEFLGIPDEERDLPRLTFTTEQRLKSVVDRLKLSKAIISTEPKGHLAYGRFFLQQKVDVLIDKPISAPVGACCQPESARQIYADYQELKDLAEQNPGTRCIVQCQRRYHDGYRQAKDLLREVINRYELPLTHLYTYHCDGLWNMPNEYAERENHPYKYGYGKLLHSGYHFVDVFAWLAELNWLIDRKRPDQLELFHQSCTPNDCVFQLDKEDYARLFGPAATQEIFRPYNSADFARFGEVDSYTQLQLKRGERTVTSGAIHLLQNGFSRRSWSLLPEDTYKANGRVRHEHLNVQVGPLLNIQIHSYESHEIRDPKPDVAPHEVGGLDHFELYIFRNQAVIGGRAVERFKVRDQANVPGYIGHNEAAREAGLRDFLYANSDERPISDIAQHELTNRLLAAIHQASAQQRQGSIPYIAEELPARIFSPEPGEYSRTYAGLAPRALDHRN